MSIFLWRPIQDYESQSFVVFGQMKIGQNSRPQRLARSWMETGIVAFVQRCRFCSSWPQLKSLLRVGRWKMVERVDCSTRQNSEASSSKQPSYEIWSYCKQTNLDLKVYTQLYSLGALNILRAQNGTLYGLVRLMCFFYYFLCLRWVRYHYLL